MSRAQGCASLPGYSCNSHLLTHVSRCSIIHTHRHTRTPPHTPGSWSNGAKPLGLVLHELTHTCEAMGQSSRHCTALQQFLAEGTSPHCHRRQQHIRQPLLTEPNHKVHGPHSTEGHFVPNQPLVWMELESLCS